MKLLFISAQTRREWPSERDWQGSIFGLSHSRGARAGSAEGDPGHLRSGLLCAGCVTRCVTLDASCVVSLVGPGSHWIRNPRMKSGFHRLRLALRPGLGSHWMQVFACQGEALTSIHFDVRCANVLCPSSVHDIFGTLFVHLCVETVGTNILKRRLRTCSYDATHSPSLAKQVSLFGVHM